MNQKQRITQLEQRVAELEKIAAGVTTAIRINVDSQDIDINHLSQLLVQRLDQQIKESSLSY